jgi:SAM-dependent methyltransferase
MTHAQLLRQEAGAAAGRIRLAMSFTGPRRIRQHELMDAPDVDPAELRRALWFIRRINRLLGYNAATLRALGELIDAAAGARAGEAVRVLDIATGSADLPQQMLRWGRRRGLAIQCVGLDLHETTLAVAREWAPEIPLVRGDGLRLPFDDDSFDVATCCMSLHHLETPAAEQVVREMERISRRGWIVADLLRRRRALAWVSLLTLFSSRLEKHDARASIRQAWLPEEARVLASSIGVPATYREVLGHRFLLVRQKDAAG